MLTRTNPDGTWRVYGVDFGDCNDNMYGALCKLRDYEATGLEPHDLDIIKGNVHIGSEIEDYKVFGVWNNCCIAVNSKVPESYVVWRIEKNGFGVHTGYYFGDLQQAQKYFYSAAIENEPDTREYWRK